MGASVSRQVSVVKAGLAVMVFEHSVVCIALIWADDVDGSGAWRTCRKSGNSSCALRSIVLGNV